MRLLVVEDDPLLTDGLLRSLRQHGYAVDHAATGTDADHMAASQAYDLIILDLGLPRMDGLEVLRRLRRRSSPSANTPVMLLTARDSLEDRVRGLDLGADDYLTKPFDLPELEARVRALVRRRHFGASNEIRHGRLVLDAAGRCASVDGMPLELSSRELAVLECLLRRTGRVVNKEQITEQLYGWGEEAGPNAIEVYVHRLRKKLEPAGVRIRTIRGLGYLVDKPPAE